MDPTFVMARIDGLQKQIRYWKISVCILLGMITASLTIQAFQIFFKPNVIVAKKFILGSKKGNPYAIFGLANDGTPSLVFYDEFDKRRVLFGLMPKAGNSPGLLLADQNGNVRMSTGLLTDGSPGFMMHGEDGKIRAGMRVDPDGSAKLECKDNQGNTAWKAP